MTCQQFLSLPPDRYRNTWVWGCTHEGCGLKPKLEAVSGDEGGARRVRGCHESLGEYMWAVDQVRHAGRPVHLCRLLTVAWLP